jgi:hypothetical protein
MSGEFLKNNFKLSDMLNVDNGNSVKVDGSIYRQTGYGYYYYNTTNGVGMYNIGSVGYNMVGNYFYGEDCPFLWYNTNYALQGNGTSIYGWFNSYWAGEPVGDYTWDFCGAISYNSTTNTFTGTIYLSGGAYNSTLTGVGNTIVGGAAAGGVITITKRDTSPVGFKANGIDYGSIYQKKNMGTSYFTNAIGFKTGSRATPETVITDLKDIFTKNPMYDESTNSSAILFDNFESGTYGQLNWQYATYASKLAAGNPGLALALMCGYDEEEYQAWDAYVVLPVSNLAGKTVSVDMRCLTGSGTTGSLRCVEPGRFLASYDYENTTWTRASLVIPTGTTQIWLQAYTIYEGYDTIGYVLFDNFAIY